MKLPSGLTVSTSATDVKQVFKDLSFFGTEFPHKCGHCKSINIVPSYRETQAGDSYYEAKCTDCGYVAKFGQYKSGGTLFFKRKEGWQPPFQPKEAGQQQGGKRLEDEPDADWS